MNKALRVGQEVALKNYHSGGINIPKVQLQYKDRFWAGSYNGKLYRIRPENIIL